MLHPFTSVQKTHPFLLKVNNNKLIKEGNKVSYMISMPYGKEAKSCCLTNYPVIHELQPLVNIRGSPMVGVDVKAFNKMSKSRSCFKSKINVNLTYEN
jgi:hypothetical protein